LHCGFNLDDVSEVLKNARVDGLYSHARKTAEDLKLALEDAVDDQDMVALADILNELGELREAIATTPEIP